ncbi:MAG TPA: hypothetical protein VN821_03010 [Candidatus Udaeobacter sp.]|nr:hypothetical protein [Candidatus Udaeobacter sp.]
MSALLRAAGCAIALGGLLAAAPAGAQNFGNVTLQPGETRKIPIMGFQGYVPMRLCNDFTSSATITAIIHPRDPRTLTPGECTEDSGYEIEVTNRGTGRDMVVWQPPAGSFFTGRMD